jgi:hypothetical protein
VKNIILVFLSLFFYFADQGSVSAQACPKGVRYDCVWGCGRHTDLNGDGFCDYSFLTAKEDPKADSLPKKDTIPTRSRADSIQVTKAKVVEPSASGKGVKDRGTEADVAPDRSDPVPLETSATETEPDSPEPVTVITPQAVDHSQYQPEPIYDLILVSVLTLGLYLVTLILYKRGVIKKVHHRKVWNLLLLLTFLVSCLFGLFLVVQINYGIAMKAYPTLLLWHVEVGISMSLIAVIHILWHIRYFRNMFQKKW